MLFDKTELGRILQQKSPTNYSTIRETVCTVCTVVYLLRLNNAICIALNVDSYQLETPLRLP